MRNYVGTGLDFLGASNDAPPSSPLTPAQLAALDRALTPVEQKIVDDWQAAQADAMQASEERPYVDPKDGKTKVAKVTYVPGASTPSAPPASPPSISTLMPQVPAAPMPAASPVKQEEKSSLPYVIAAIAAIIVGVAVFRK